MLSHRSRGPVAAVAATLVLAGCSAATGVAGPSMAGSTAPGTSSGPGTSAPTGTPQRQGPVSPDQVSTLVTGLRTPWGLAFLPGGDALLSERDTALVKRVTPAGQVTTVGQVPGVVPGGEGGLLGIAVDARFAQDRWLYAYFTADSDNRVVRMRYTRAGLGTPDVLVDGIAKAGIHNGGRLAFGPDGMLYIGTGDASQSDRSQDRSSLNGKILRVRPDGRVPDDNPFPGSPVWSYGHRNVQGLAFDNAGRLWASEFGQHEYDELNLIEKGRNYGWPVVEGPGGGSEYVQPVVDWTPTFTCSPSGIAWVRDTVFVAALAGTRLYVVPVDGASAGAPVSTLEDHGRLRTVGLAPDGSLWVTTSNTDGRGNPRDGDDRILRMTLRPS